VITSQPSPTCALFAPNIARRVFRRRQPVFYRVEFEVESLLKGSHPLPGNDAKVRKLLDQSLRGNHMGLNTPRDPA